MRNYGGGKIELTQKTAEMPLYTQYIFRYPPDGLTIDPARRGAVFGHHHAARRGRPGILYHP